MSALLAGPDHPFSGAQTFGVRPALFVRHSNSVNRTRFADDGGLKTPEPIDQTKTQPPSMRPVSGQPEASPDILVLIALHRRTVDLARAQQRLDLQCQAVVRRYSGGDKKVAAKRWRLIKKGGDDELLTALTPYWLAMEPLIVTRAGLLKQTQKMVRRHPLAAWAAGVRGFGEPSLVTLLGGAGRELYEYRSPAALWKRFGLAVMPDGRQRRIAGEAALAHGYSPQRRAVAWNWGNGLMRKQGPDGPYRAIYDARKAYELERGLPKGHAHNRAMRFMVKALLKDAWRASRQEVFSS